MSVLAAWLHLAGPSSTMAYCAMHMAFKRCPGTRLQNRIHVRHLNTEANMAVMYSVHTWRQCLSSYINSSCPLSPGGVHVLPGLLQVDPVALPAALQARTGLQEEGSHALLCHALLSPRPPVATPFCHALSLPGFSQGCAHGGQRLLISTRNYQPVLVSSRPYDNNELGKLAKRHKY